MTGTALLSKDERRTKPGLQERLLSFFIAFHEPSEGAWDADTQQGVMKDLAEYTSVVDDFQHRIEAKIRKHGAEKGFPGQGNVSDDELSDYLFEYQAALDSKGSERQRYTIAGILIILPVLILSAFPNEQLPLESQAHNFLLAIAIGLCLFGLYYLLSQLMVRLRIRKVNNAHPEAKWFVEQVRRF